MTSVPAEPQWGPRQWLRVRLWSLAFLGFLAYPVVALLHSGLPAARVALGFAGLAAFIVPYVRVIWRSVPVPYQNATPYSLTAVLAVGVALVPVLGYDRWAPGLVFYASALLLTAVRRRWRGAAVGTVVALFVAGGLLLRVDRAEVFGVALTALAVGALQIAFARQIEDNVRNRREKAELARLAVAEERLRISRDLHDVLGQRLAAVALKADLATKLLRADPDRAEAEMAEVGRVAREALDEVRATVGGYRDVSLDSELRSALAVLAAAGVDATASGVPVGLSPAVEEVAAWVVREATTNVVRHARAGRCRLVVGRDPDGLVVEIADDGRAADGTASVCLGHGLAGLTERIRALGGTFAVGAADGWFRVRATVPA